MLDGIHEFKKSELANVVTMFRTVFHTVFRASTRAILMHNINYFCMV